MLAKRISELDAGAAPRTLGRPLASVPQLYQYQVVPPFSCDEDGYPESDSAPVEGEPHTDVLYYVVPVVKARFGHRGRVRTNGPIYYEEGNPRACIVPDMFVALGVGEEARGTTYKLWRFPVPDFVLEVMSPDSWRDDLGAKKATYQYLGVQEYWVFDSRGAPAKRGRRRVAPPLAGFRLAGGVYEPVLPDNSDRLLSEVLDLELRLHDWDLHLHDVQTGERLLSYPEEQAERFKERDWRLREQEGRLRERDERLKERDGRLKEQAGRLKERDGRLKEQDGRLKERDGRLKERSGRLKERDGRLKERDDRLKERDGRLKEKAARLTAETALQQEADARRAAEARLAALEAELQSRRNT